MCTRSITYFQYSTATVFSGHGFSNLSFNFPKSFKINFFLLADIVGQGEYFVRKIIAKCRASGLACTFTKILKANTDASEG